MKSHLVLMVHGIGEQVAGDTVDEFVGAARTELDLQVPIDSAKIMLSETHKPSDKHALFPCQTRTAKTKKGDELLFAEVHWADLSRAPDGVIATVFDLMHVVFGLGYIALDNVEKNSPFNHPWIAKCVHFFVWLFYALIAPINAVLFLGAIALLVDPYLIRVGPDGVSPAWILLGVGVAALFGATAMRGRVHTYLTRCFRRGAEMVGATTILLSFVAISQIEVVGLGVFTDLCQIVARPDLEENLETLTGNNALSCYVGAAVVVLNGLGFLAVLMLLGLAITSLGMILHARMSGAKPSSKVFDHKRSFYLAVCAALMVFATFFIIGFWVAFADTIDRLEGQDPILLGQILERHFGLATQTFGYIFAALVMVVVAAVILSVRRVIEAARQRRKGVIALTFDRLILSPAINWGLTFAIFFIAAGAVHAYAAWTLQYVDPYDGVQRDALNLLRDRLDIVHIWIEPISRWALLAVGGLMFLIFNNATVVASVLGVARDIVVYSTRSHAKAPDERSPNHSRYFLRERIDARFDAVMAALATPGRWDSITVVSHSQGTVVASRGLRRYPVLDPKPTFVTMGSPLGHIYCQYFDKDFLPTQPMQDKVKAWVNVFRCDDYVGTMIEGYDPLVYNAPAVRAAGHRHYWTDGCVWAALKKRHANDPSVALPGFGTQPEPDVQSSRPADISVA